MVWYQDLEAFVRERVPLAPLTNYRVGGPAEYFAEPPDEDALTCVLRRAAEHDMPVRMLGHGTNLLVSDAGVRGLVVRLPKSGFAQLRRDGATVYVGAGHSLPGLVKWSVGAGLGGLECLVGVPGTVGAALRMNAGGKYGEIGTRISNVAGCSFDGRAFEVRGSDCGFGYRDSDLKHGMVTRCEMKLEDSAPEHGAQELRRILEEKRATQPLSDRSAGCVFKNPKRPGVPPAGRLIDEQGFKGVRLGRACVSAVHANFLVCEAGATAADLARLIRCIRTRVLRENGVLLELEIEAWGFEKNELAASA